MLGCGPNWKGMRWRGKGKTYEAVGRPGARECEAAGGAKVGFARILVITVITSERDKGSLRNYSKLTISFTVFTKRTRAGQLV